VKLFEPTFLNYCAGSISPAARSHAAPRVERFEAQRIEASCAKRAPDDRRCGRVESRHTLHFDSKKPHRSPSVVEKCERSSCAATKHLVRPRGLVHHGLTRDPSVFADDATSLHSCVGPTREQTSLFGPFAVSLQPLKCSCAAGIICNRVARYNIPDDSVLRAEYAGTGQTPRCSLGPTSAIIGGTLRGRLSERSRLLRRRASNSPRP